jgi:hypothetical protein
VPYGIPWAPGKAGRSRRVAIHRSSDASPAASTTKDAPGAASEPRRGGIPRGAWVLLPLAAALVYAGASALLRKSPALERMVPDDAIATWRFKDLAAYDALRTPADAGGQVVRHQASEVMGAELNLPALAGVDRHRPLLTVTLDPTRRADAGFFVLPVEDASKVRETFASDDLRERHARSVVVHGDWAAAGWDLLTVDRAGNGHGVYPAERGELWSVAVDWPKFVDAALRPESVTTEPARTVLAALGFDPSTARIEDGALTIPDAGRVPLVRNAWSRLELHAFEDRIRAELWPAAEDLVQALRAPSSATTSPPSGAPPRAEAWLSVGSARARRALALVLGYAGMKWPTAVGKDDFKALHLDAEGGLLVYAEPAGGTTLSWTLVLDGPAASMPDLAAFGPAAPAVGEVATLPMGSAPLSTPYGPASAAPEVAVRARGTADRIVAIGVDARVAAELRATEKPVPLDAPQQLLARFGLSHVAAQRLLGPALAKMGLLSSLAGGDIEGTLSVENGRLVLEARVTRRP